MHNYSQTSNVAPGWDFVHMVKIYSFYAATHFLHGIFDLSTIWLKCLTLYYFSVCIAYFSLIVLISVGNFNFFCRFTFMPAFLFYVCSSPRLVLLLVCTIYFSFVCWFYLCLSCVFLLQVELHYMLNWLFLSNRPADLFSERCSKMRWKKVGVVSSKSMMCLMTSFVLLSITRSSSRWADGIWPLVGWEVWSKAPEGVLWEVHNIQSE